MKKFWLSKKEIEKLSQLDRIEYRLEENNVHNISGMFSDIFYFFLIFNILIMIVTIILEETTHILFLLILMFCFYGCLILSRLFGVYKCVKLDKKYKRRI